MANDSIHEEESKFVKELVASREYLFKQLVDMCIEVNNKYREIAWRWIMDNRKWPSRYKVPCRPSYRNNWNNKEYKFGWYMSNKDNSRTMEQVADKASSTIPYELTTWGRWVRENELKQWYLEEEALLWLVRQLCHMMKAKDDNEAAKKSLEVSAGNQIS